MKVEIRPYREGDEALLFEAASESVAEVEPWLPWCHENYTQDEAREWIAIQCLSFAEKREFQFVVLDEAGQYLGGCGINRIDAEHRFANLGYWIRSSRTRSGAASAATKLVAEWSFEHTSIERLEIVVATGNVASARVAEKAGAHFEGILRERLCIAGTQHDARMYAIVRSSA